MFSDPYVWQSDSKNQNLMFSWSENREHDFVYIQQCDIPPFSSKNKKLPYKPIATFPAMAGKSLKSKNF